ncbi:MAG TPA: vWA domain-containing protein [Candidatus Kapabacteria bacterium]
MRESSSEFVSIVSWKHHVFPAFAGMTLVFCSFTLRAQDISLTLKRPLALLHIDSTSANEAWVEVSGLNPPPLKAEDLTVRRGNQRAEILSVDSVGWKFKSSLRASFVLDNSGSMFHAFDSLTKYCDTLLDSLPRGGEYQAVVFDTHYRNFRSRYTARRSTFLSQFGFTESRDTIQSFWHDYDTIRTQYTPLYDAIADAVSSINAYRRKGDTAWNDALLVVTDGADNASTLSIEALQELLANAPIKLYAINFRVEDEGRLPWLARQTGGYYYLADDLTELHTILRTIGHTITREYRVRYRFPTLGPSSGR